MLRKLALPFPRCHVPCKCGETKHPFQVQAVQYCLRACLHAVVAALQASWALVKEERASVCIAAERVAMATVPVEQAGQHCLRVCLHVLAALCCLLKPL